MKHSRLISTAIGLAMAMIATAQTTLNDCQKWAAENYPLLKRYELLQATTDYTRLIWRGSNHVHEPQ